MFCLFLSDLRARVPLWGIFNLANMRLSALRAMDDLLRHLSLDGMEADDGSIIGVSL